MQSYEIQRDAVVCVAVEIVSTNRLIEEDQIKSIRDAVNNAWCDGMNEREWLDAALAQLGIEG
jgi:hypothetical protein